MHRCISDSGKAAEPFVRCSPGFIPQESVVDKQAKRRAGAAAPPARKANAEYVVWESDSDMLPAAKGAYG